MSLLTLSNPVFRGFAFYAAGSVLKMMAMAPLTARARFKNKAFANPEDAGPSGLKVKTDENVERVRRNHLNDLENIVPFVLLGFCYVAIDPTLNSALWHFRVFFVSRVLHTLSYQIPIPQPSRALTFFAGLGVNISMAVQIMRAAF